MYICAAAAKWKGFTTCASMGGVSVPRARSQNSDRVVKDSSWYLVKIGGCRNMTANHSSHVGEQTLKAWFTYICMLGFCKNAFTVHYLITRHIHIWCIFWKGFGDTADWLLWCDSSLLSITEWTKIHSGVILHWRLLMHLIEFSFSTPRKLALCFLARSALVCVGSPHHHLPNNLWRQKSELWERGGMSSDGRSRSHTVERSCLSYPFTADGIVCKFYKLAAGLS